jgi:cytochrome c oxidase subunit 2
MFGAAGSELAREVDRALAILVGTSLVIWVGIVFLMIYFVVRFRRSRIRRTRQIHGHTLLEVTWTVIPTFLVVGMFFVGYRGFATMRSAPEGAMEVEVLGQQWFWSFTYPEAGISAPELYIPVETPVKLRITAPEGDVVHSFYVPAFRVKEDAVPGAETSLWLEAEETGTYNIFCAEYCGKNHSQMISRLHVVPAERFTDWLREQRSEKFRPVEAGDGLDPASEVLQGVDGRLLYNKYCAACHGPNGEGGGPYRARDFRTASGWKRSAKLTDIFRTISLGLEGTQMRAFRNLPVRERFALVHQVASFLPEGERPAVTEADIQALKEEFPETDPSSYTPPALEPAMTLEEAMREVVRREAGGGETR